MDQESQERLNTIDWQHILERRKDFFPSSYLTIIAIMQSLALTLLLYQFEKKPLSPDTCQTLLYYSRFIVTFFVIVTVWHEYHWASFIFFWTPRVKDSVIPFGIGVLEAACIYNIENPHLFSLLIGLLSFGGVVAYKNTLRNYKNITFVPEIRKFSKNVKFVSNRAIKLMCANGCVGLGGYFSLKNVATSFYQINEIIILCLFSAVVTVLLISSNNLMDYLNSLIDIKYKKESALKFPLKVVSVLSLSKLKDHHQ